MSSGLGPFRVSAISLGCMNPGMFEGKRGLDGSPEAITATLHGALKRLRTDHIDLYYLHRLDSRVPIEDSVGAFGRAKEMGLTGAIGLSEMSAATLRRAHAVHPIAAMLRSSSSDCRRSVAFRRPMKAMI